MVLRTARRGRGTGSNFWGCSRYPSCRGTVAAAAGTLAGPSSGTTVTSTSAIGKVTPVAPAIDPQRIAGVTNLIRYYIGCVEAEGLKELVLEVAKRGQQFVVIAGAPEAVMSGQGGEWREISQESSVVSWWQRRALTAGRERVLYGYPVVAGFSREGPVIAPLFYTEVQLRKGTTGVELQPLNGAVELNLFALTLLGLDHNDRAETIDALAELGGGWDERLAKTFEILAELGTVQPPTWTAEQLLEDVGTRPGLHHTAMLFASERAQQTAQLLRDLEEMAAMRPQELMASAPLACLMGYAASPAPPSPRPQPTIIPSNLSQDRAITGALDTALTVVTGPPGTGKSQVLVNAVAAALSRGESVLFASFSNRAVDVVFQRLSAVSTEAVPLRVGAARLRNNTASEIRSALARAKSAGHSMPEARQGWAAIAARLESLYASEGRRLGVERKVEESDATYMSSAAGLPSSLTSLTDPDHVEALLAALDQARYDIGKPIRSPFFRGRKRRQCQQLVQTAWETLLAAIPARFAVPLDRTCPVDPSATTRTLRAACVAAKQAAISQTLRAELAGMPDHWAIQERIRDLDDTRVRAARQLFDAEWVASVRNAAPKIRSAAGTYADAIGSLTGGGKRASVRSSVPDMLKMFPVWGVTSLSTRTNFDLDRGLFDLVVVDEASQCDIASALPLLFRAKRAMIIGDGKQLLHITTLSVAQDREIATRSGVPNDQQLSMGYRTTSLFSLAARSVGEAPLFLEEHYRSHKAIITFSNDLFYGSRLIILTDEGAEESSAPVRWVQVAGEARRGPRGTSVVNDAEVAAVVRVVKELIPTIGENSLGVVAPYRAHVEAIRDRLRGVGLATTELVVDTAHRFQGEERDIMLFSPTVSMGMQDFRASFANNSNLVNVAVTRAREQLIVVGDRAACLKVGGVLGQLAQYAADLEDGRFDSPLERKLHDALQERGLTVVPGYRAEEFRLDLAFVTDDIKLDIECDGAAFHRERRGDRIRDARLTGAGWTVMRFDGRAIIGDIGSCVRKILATIERSKKEGSPAT